MGGRQVVGVGASAKPSGPELACGLPLDAKHTHTGHPRPNALPGRQPALPARWSPGALGAAAPSRFPP
eukprot:33778-Alexandrium_andersonii.AAC.1